MRKLRRMLRFKDLKDNKIVQNRMTLRRWMELPDDPFPASVPLGENTNAWFEDEVAPWVERRAALRAVSITPPAFAAEGKEPRQARSRREGRKSPSRRAHNSKESRAA